jgi:hypothetical protein
MIIGTIVDVSGGNAPASNIHNGVASIVFYTEDDGIKWCELMSESANYNGVNLQIGTMLVNTDTSIRRWWFNGIEYTG